MIRKNYIRLAERREMTLAEFTIFSGNNRVVFGLYKNRFFLFCSSRASNIDSIGYRKKKSRKRRPKTHLLLPLAACNKQFNYVAD